MNVLVLSLNDANDRRKYILEHLSSNNIEFEFFNAIEPKDLSSDLFEKRSSFLSKEAVATFESHRRIIEKVKEINDFTLILEDDALVNIDGVKQKIDDLLKAKNDFDILFLGYKTRHISKERNNVIDIDSNFQKINNFFELHSYIVNPKSVDKILSLLGRPNSHVDARISDLIWEDKIYGIFVKENLFIQNKSFQTQIPKKIKIKHMIDDPKIFQIGFNKCGTTSIHQFFLDNDLKSIHWDKGKLARRIRRNYEMNIPLLMGYETFECFTDMESAITDDIAYIDFYKELDRQYPGSKFILNTRDMDNWINSRLNHGEGSYLEIYKRNNNLTEQEVIEYWKKQWNTHIDDVRNYFKDRPEDFLIFDIETESDKFVEFMSSFKNIKKKLFGNFNVTKNKPHLLKKNL